MHLWVTPKKIGYLGERNSILPGQMAEQLAVEVDVKNVTQHGSRCKKCYVWSTHGQALIFALDDPKNLFLNLQNIFLPPL